MNKPLRYQHYKDYQLVEVCPEKPFMYINKYGTHTCIRTGALARVYGFLCYGYLLTAIEISSGVQSTLFKIEDFVKEGITVQAIYDGFYEDYVVEAI